MSTATRYEHLVGLHVSDDETYTKYRAAMTPLLEAVGGFFRFDFTIDKTLKGGTDPEINRLFVISFPDQATSERFFEEPAYVAAREQFFDASVDMVERIASFDHAEN
ncbi:MAG: hypothetical protein ACI8TQ_002270 [Planctomycetota bacterium]|jgi:uncharacterized protein (DUF1330 family)